MIHLEDILLLHYLSIEDFGGSHGIRDEQGLLSAISRPYQTFDGKELYPSAIEKAAALCESLITNHPFVDGNKRIGLLATLAMLNNNGIDINVAEELLYEFIINISTGNSSFDDIVSWIQHNSNNIKG